MEYWRWKLLFIKYCQTIKDEVSRAYFKSLHIIDPRIGKKKFKLQLQRVLGKTWKWVWRKLLYNHLPNVFRRMELLLFNLLQLNKCWKHCVQSINTKICKKEHRTILKSKELDFSIEFPYFELNKPKGIVIEIVDGSQHQNSEQQFLNTAR